MRVSLFLLFIFIAEATPAQQKLEKLTVEKIMRDPKWIGSSPSNPNWSLDGRLYFNWNPSKAPADSIYFITLSNKKPQKATPQESVNHNSTGNIIYDQSRVNYVY